MSKLIYYLLCATISMTPLFANKAENIKTLQTIIDQPPSEKPILPSPDSDTQKIKERGVLRVCTQDKERSPFMFYVDGIAYGIDMEVADTIAYFLDVPMDIVFTKTPQEVVDYVASGKCDIGVSRLSLDMQEANEVLYTNSYISLRPVLIFNRVALEKVKSEGDRNVMSILRKSTRVIGVIKDSNYEYLAKDLFRNATIKSFSSWEDEIIPKLMKGELLCAFSDEWEAYKLMITIEKSPLKLLAVVLKGEVDPINVIVPLKQFQLRDWINNLFVWAHLNYQYNDLIDYFYNGVDYVKSQNNSNNENVEKNEK